MTMRRIIESVKSLLSPRRIVADKKFNRAVEIILAHEGGVSNHKNDKGGKSAYGISSRFLRNEKIDIDIETLTRDQAITIYRTYFWDKYGYYNLKDEQIATKVFDMAVNIGPKAAAEILQEAIQALLPTSKFIIDGIIGIKTTTYANQINPGLLIIKLRELQKEYYENIVFDDPTQKVFLKGWLKRAAW